MASTSHATTAKISQFPVKARAASGYRNSLSALEMAAAAYAPRVEYGSARYHDAAIADDKASRKRDGH